MATCPSCGVKGREVPDAFTVEQVLVAKPLGTWSLAGAQMKTVARMMDRLTCNRCGWRIDGRLTSDGFDGDTSTQVFPAKEPTEGTDPC